MNKSTQKVLFSSQCHDWETPKSIYNKLDTMFGPFVLDSCADKENAKCQNYYSLENGQNGLILPWQGKIFCNPPYKTIDKWIKKAYIEAIKQKSTVVMLLPSRTDTKWFCTYCMKAKEIYFLKGRIKFENAKNTAPFPSLIAIFDGYCYGNVQPVFHILETKYLTKGE